MFHVKHFFITVKLFHVKQFGKTQTNRPREIEASFKIQKKQCKNVSRETMENVKQKCFT